MARAIWNGRVIAESNQAQDVDGVVYFPESSLKREYFRASSTTSTGSLEGPGALHDRRDGWPGQPQDAAIWYYPDPKPVARKVKGYVAFWRGVEVEK